LQARLDNFEEQNKVKVREEQSLRRANDAINAEITRLNSELQSLNAKMGQALSMKDQLDQAKSDQLKLVKSVGDKFSVPKPRHDINSPEFIKAFLQSLNEKVQ